MGRARAVERGNYVRCATDLQRLGCQHVHDALSPHVIDAFPSLIFAFWFGIRLTPTHLNHPFSFIPPRARALGYSTTIHEFSHEFSRHRQSMSCHVITLFERRDGVGLPNSVISFISCRLSHSLSLPFPSLSELYCDPSCTPKFLILAFSDDYPHIMSSDIDLGAFFPLSHHRRSGKGSR